MGCSSISMSLSYSRVRIAKANLGGYACNLIISSFSKILLVIFLHKILPLFVMPIIIYLFVVIVGTKKEFKSLIYISSIIFYIISTPIFSNYLFKKIEGEYIYKNLNEFEEVDAIVILSGMMRINEFDENYIVEWGDVDRLFKGIKLYELNKSNTIIFTGGKNPYNSTTISEGEVLKEFAIKHGVKKDDILITKDVLNTADESLAVLNLIGDNQTIILVTSAFHMKRAKLLFESQGFNVVPFKVDFNTPPNIKSDFIDFIPSSSGLRITEIAFREVLGRLYYDILL